MRSLHGRAKIVGNSFAGGQDSIYSVTKEGFERRAELFADAKEAG